MKLLHIKFVLLFTLVFGYSNAQMESPEDKVKAVFSLEQNGCEAYVVAKVTVVPGWHINSNKLPSGSFSIPTNLTVNSLAGVSIVSGVIEPKPVIENNTDIDEILSYHKGTFTLKRKVLISSDKDISITGAFSFQTCNEVKCLPEFTMKFSLPAKACSMSKEKLDSVLASSPAASANENHQLVTNSDKKIITPKKANNIGSNNSIWVIFFLSFLSGFAALLTPCVFPMIPMTVSFFTKTSKNKAKGIRNALFYGFSIIAIYVILGTIVTAIFGPAALNALSTNVWFNLVFFILLVVFAISFMGAFEITLPNSWLNKADKASDKGGFIGIFFMALALALVSFSCTGPIVGTLLVQSASIGGIAPFVGMFGFSLALALPFTLFAAFPGWMNSLPKSGGWLNTVKVFLGFLELALAFKFLSTADLVSQAHLLERELFIAIWIGIFTSLAIYLFGGFKLPHDSPLERLSVGRVLLGTTTLIFVAYLIPGMWGAPLKLISGFPPSPTYSEWKRSSESPSNSIITHEEGMHEGVHGIMMFDDYDKALTYAKKVNKPLMLDFTGWGCQNCRKMEETVWNADGVLSILKDQVVVASLYVDEKKELPISEHKELEYAPGKKMAITQVGHKWGFLQMSRYKSNSQPHYRMLSPDGKDLENGSADFEHHGNAPAFKKWLEDGLKLSADGSNK
jgi:thiol:disulfide interchange protein DsbD